MLRGQKHGTGYFLPRFSWQLFSPLQKERAIFAHSGIFGIELASVRQGHLAGEGESRKWKQDNLKTFLKFSCKV